MEKDFKNLAIQKNINNIDEASNFKKMFGENIVTNMYESIGKNYLENRNNGSMNVNANGYINFNKEGIKVEKHNFYGE